MRKSSSSTWRVLSAGVLIAELIACVVAFGFRIFGTPQQLHRAVLAVLCLGLLTGANMLFSLRQQRSYEAPHGADPRT